MDLDLHDTDFATITLDGMPYSWHVPTGWHRPIVRGGDGDDPPPPPPGGDKTFTQADVDKLLTQARKDGAKEGAKTAAADLATQLGVSVEEAAKIIKAAQEAEAAEQSEVDKLKAALADSEARGKAAEAAAAKATLDAKIERALLAAKVPDAGVSDVAKLVTVDADADDEAIKTAVEALKTKLPGLFSDAAVETDEDDETGLLAPSPAAPGQKPPAGGPAPKSPVEQGREAARAARTDQPATPPDPFAGLRS